MSSKHRKYLLYFRFFFLQQISNIVMVMRSVYAFLLPFTDHHFMYIYSSSVFKNTMDWYSTNHENCNNQHQPHFHSLPFKFPPFLLVLPSSSTTCCWFMRQSSETSFLISYKISWEQIADKCDTPLTSVERPCNTIP